MPKTSERQDVISTLLVLAVHAVMEQDADSSVESDVDDNCLSSSDDGTSQIYLRALQTVPDNRYLNSRQKVCKSVEFRYTILSLLDDTDFDKK